MEQENMQNEEQLAALLQLAGRRRAVDPEVTRRVRSAVHDTWHEELAGRKRRRTIGWASGLAAAIAIAAFLSPRHVGPPPSAVAIADVQLLRGNTSLITGRAITVGSTISTAPRSLATLQWRQRGSLRIAPDSRVRFISANTLQVDRGAIYFASIAGSSPITVRTKHGVVRDIGTEFEVRVNAASMRVRVREGAVELQRNGASDRAEAGVELTASAEGVTRAAIATSGEEWNWVLAAAPPIVLEGNARVVLTAIAREKGLKLVFTDRALAERVDRISLHDRVPLTPDEALDAATVAANLSYRVSGNTLTIDRRQSR